MIRIIFKSLLVLFLCSAAKAETMNYFLCEGEFFQGQGTVENKIQDFSGFAENSKIALEIDKDKIRQIDGTDIFSNEKCKWIQNETALFCNGKMNKAGEGAKYEKLALFNRWTGQFSADKKSWFGDESTTALGFRFNGFCEKISGPMFKLSN